MPFGAVAPSGRLNCGALGSVHADLVDLSEGGLCLMLPTPLALNFGDRVELVLHENFGVGSLHIELEVRWTQANPMGLKLGLRFLDPQFCPSGTFLRRYLDTDFFSDRRSVSSRRSSPRRVLPIGQEGLMGQLACPGAGWAEVQVMDLSKGGVCVSFSGPLAIHRGQMVMLSLRDSLSSDTLALEAQVRWLQTTPAGHTAGLQFSDHRFAPSRTFLRRYLAPGGAADPPSPSA
jgi:hypothetical protein